MKIINSIFKTFVLSALMIAQVHFCYAQNAAILPPAKTTFVDQNGKPLTSGKVDFYIPGTTTRKTTWQDANATIANTNPVILDAAGRALILGSGAYRQVVKDRNDNIIWDQVTNSAGAGGSGQSTVGDGLAVGSILPWSGLVAPVNYAFAYGQELSRTNYATLKSAITLTQNITCVSGNATVTSVADTSQLNVGAAVEAACLPASTVIVSKTSNTVTVNNLALASTTSSAIFYPWGAGNGLTTFNVPDLRGAYLPGRNNMGGSSSANLSSPYYTDPNSLGGSGGAQSKTILNSNLPSYTPSGTVTNGAITFPSTLNTSTANGSQGAITTGPVGAGGNFTTLLNAQQATSTFTGNSNWGGIAVSATVVAGGSGYTAGTQLLTVSGGTCTTQPQFNVTVSAGAITAPVLVTAGQCSVVPSNPVATTGGGGTGGTLNVIYSAVPFSLIPPSKTINYVIKIAPDVSLSVANCANLQDAGTACTANVGTSGHNLPYLDGNNTWSGTNAFGTVTITGGSITGMPLPTLGPDVATKQYVDNIATGLNVLAQTKYATAAVLPNTPTYSNGALGVGATLTAGANSTLTVDGNVVALGEVVLVKNQASAFQNGVYTLTTAGSGATPWVLTRATYFDQAAEMKAGSYTFVTNGSTNTGTSYVLQTAVTTVGTDALNWVLFASSVAGVSQLDSTQGAITTQAGGLKVVSGQLSSNVLSSRTFAITQNLTSFSSIQTQGYASAGDGGNATFIKTSGRFLDTVVTSGSITNAGVGYTNGSYLYVPLTGSATGIATYANVTVSGGIVSAVTILDVNGRGAASLAGDVLTTANTNIGGTGSGFTWTISAMTSPLASFTDSAGNRFQYVVSNGNHINPKQFGCKFDWLGVDASATDDGACIQASLNFASISKYVRQDLGGTLASTKVMLPAGSALICQGLILPGATQLFGQGPFNSTLKVCDTGLSSFTHIVTMCDQNAHVACFGAQIGQLGINAFNATGSANAWAIFSNAAQQTRAIDNVTVYSGTRGCLKYSVGYGGAANFSVYDLFCTINTGAPNDGVQVATDVGTVLVNFRNTIIESGGVGFGGNGFNIGGGQVNIDGYHFEGIAFGINVNQTVSTHSTSVMHLTGGASCTNAVVLQSTNTPGNFAIYDAVKQGSCALLVSNGQPAGSNRAADAKPSAGWVFFNP